MRVKTPIIVCGLMAFGIIVGLALMARQEIRDNRAFNQYCRELGGFPDYHAGPAVRRRCLKSLEEISIK